MKTLIAWLNVALIIGGAHAADAGNWAFATAMWVFVIADRLDEIACAARASGRNDGR